jgi:hypothetical protein
VIATVYKINRPFIPVLKRNEALATSRGSAMRQMQSGPVGVGSTAGPKIHWIVGIM